MGYYPVGTRVRVFRSFWAEDGEGEVIEDEDWIMGADSGNLVALDNHQWVWAAYYQMEALEEKVS